jgi:hypothetical protein
MKSFAQFVKTKEETIQEGFEGKTLEELMELLKHHEEDMAKAKDDCKEDYAKEIAEIKAAIEKMKKSNKEESEEKTNEKVNIELEEFDDGAFEVSSEYLSILVEGKVAQITAGKGNESQFEIDSKDLKEICKKLLSKM